MTCGDNPKAQADVVSPIKPEFCPMCGAKAGSVIEWRSPDKFRDVEKHERLADRLKAAGFSESGEGDVVSRKWPGPE